jgi:hypothetical protein
MRAARSAVVALVIAGTIAGTTAMSSSRHGDEHVKTVFNQALIGLPATQKIAIDGVPAAGAPWTIDNGSRATISASGQLRVHVRGLLITGTGGPNDGTVGPVKQVVASLACASGVAATTNPVPLSSDGDAKIHATVAVPTTCLAPVVLVRIFGNQPANPWIAATGLSTNGG